MYYIYHIPGIKVGCTNDIETRTYQNKKMYGEDIEVVVIATTPDLNQANWLEKDLHQHYGYGELYSHESYSHMVELNKKSTEPQVRKKAGKSISKAKKGKELPWLNTAENFKKRGKSISKALTGKFVGENNSNYGKGRVYKDLISGVEGTFTEISKLLDVKPHNIIPYLRKNRPVKRKNGTIVHLVVA